MVRLYTDTQCRIYADEDKDNCMQIYQYEHNV